MARSWQKRANKLLKPHYSKRKIGDSNFYVRLVATRFPKPTFAIAIWEDGEKLGEFAIFNPDEFVEDVQDAWEQFIRPEYERWLDEQNDRDYENEDEDEEEDRPKRRKKASKRRSKRKIKRD